jgi:hypothetical protein
MRFPAGLYTQWLCAQAPLVVPGACLGTFDQMCEHGHYTQNYAHEPRILKHLYLTCNERHRIPSFRAVAAKLFRDAERC